MTLQEGALETMGEESRPVTQRSTMHELDALANRFEAAVGDTPGPVKLAKWDERVRILRVQLAELRRTLGD